MRLIAERYDATPNRWSRTTIWLGLRSGARWKGLLAFCILCAAMACRAAPATTPAPPTPTASSALAELHVNVLPAGSTVRVNGEERGETALRLDLPAGQYQVIVEHVGYRSLQRDVQLLPGQVTVIAEALDDSSAPVVELAGWAATVQAGDPVALHARATDNEAVALVRLSIDGQQVAESHDSVAEYEWNTQDTALGAHAILAEAQDAAGNVGQVTGTVRIEAAPAPQPSPTLAPTPTTAPTVKVYETTLTLPAYPYEAYLKERTDPRYNLTVAWLDRAGYEAAGPHAEPRSFKAVVLENPYLRLTFLPQLGGRLYQCVFKPTGQNVFYQNAVIKPSYWGPLSRDENWWLAVGGMEWALPVQEHGYEWGVPWSYQVERRTAETSIVLRDSTAGDRLQAEVRVTLPANRAYFVVEPRLVNPTGKPVPLQFWLNALLTLGSPSTSPDTEFTYPTTQMIVHSTGDGALPAERQIMSWPEVGGRDLSHYGNWRNWLGVFVPDIQQDYVGAYNHDTGLGIARIFPHQIAPGLKLFGFGANFAARSEFSDDGSDYFEMWGGPCRTFWPEDDVIVGPGESLSWSEVWLPFSGIGALDVANANVVVRADVQGGQVDVGIAASSAQRGLLEIEWNGQAFHQEAVQLDPQKPITLELPLPTGAGSTGQLSLRLTDVDGRTLLEYSSMQ